MPTPRSPQTRLAHVAQRQHGAVTRAQARWCGFTDRQIDLRIASGALVPLRRGVLAMAGSPPTWEQAVAGAALASGADALTCQPTAGRLWAVRGTPRADAIHVLSSSADRRARRPGIVGHRSSIIDPQDRGRRAGIPVTSFARTLVDLAGDLGAAGLAAALDDGLRRRVVTLEGLRSTAARLLVPGRPHRRVVAEVLADRLPGYHPGDSDLEVRALRRIRAAGLPVPVQQHPVAVDGRELHLDLAYPPLLVAIELDGWEWHGHRTAFDRDRRRLSALAAAGWAVLVATSRTVDDELVPLLAALLERRQTDMALRRGA